MVDYILTNNVFKVNKNVRLFLTKIGLLNCLLLNCCICLAFFDCIKAGECSIVKII